jgi:hypothetical protein
MNRHAIAWLCVLPGLQAAAIANTGNRAQMTLDGDRPYHRLSLPSSLYGYADSPSLDDIRIENATGASVPFSWLHADTKAPERAMRPVPYFVIPAAVTATRPGATWLRPLPDGSLIAINGAPVAVRSPSREWIVDASAIKSSLLNLHVRLQPGVRGLFVLSIDGSDDLQHWRQIADDNQLLALERNGMVLERLSLSLGGVAVRYLRLRWKTASPSVTRLTVESIVEHEPVPPMEWSTPLRADHCDTNRCSYVLPRNMPISSLQIRLSDPNSLGKVRIKGLMPTQAVKPVYHNPLHILRHKRLHLSAAAETVAEIRKVWLTESIVYRLTQPEGEAVSAEIPLSGGVYPALQLEMDEPISRLGSAPPQIVVGTLPRSLVFLAHGQGPYALRWRAQDNGPGAAMPLSELIPGFKSGQTLATGRASVDLMPAALPTWRSSGLDAQPTPAPPTLPPDDKKRWLWAALVMGLLVLGGMAYSLFRSMDKKSAELK